MAGHQPSLMDYYIPSHIRTHALLRAQTRSMLPSLPLHGLYIHAQTPPYLMLTLALAFTENLLSKLNLKQTAS